MISSAVSVALATFFFLFGFSAVQVADTKAILTTCGIPAAEAEALTLFQTVLAIAEKQPTNAAAQLTALETNFKTGVICALQQIANGQPGPQQTIAMNRVTITP